jgi:hypothetical protein
LSTVPKLVALLGVAFAASGFQPPQSAIVGTVTGRVTEANSGDPAKPIRKALIILKQAQEAGTGAYTDDKGNFSLQVEPATYSIAVERDGYVAAAQSRTRTITVQGEQTAVDVNLEMVHTGVVSGRVLDSDGEPMPRASVQLHAVPEKRVGPFLGGSTDDRGAYRIFQIPPGKYRLSVTFQPAFQEREIKLQTRDGKEEESYATTYFPGASDIAQATVIDVPAGADLAGIDLQLRRVHAVHVRGRIIGIAAGPLSVAIVTLVPAGSRSSTGRDTLVRDPAGAFDLSGVLPGKYVLYATSPDFVTRGAGPSAQRAVEVGQTDVEDIQLMLAPPQAVKGRVTVPEGRKVPEGLIVMLSGRSGIEQQGDRLGKVRSDGTFTLASVPAGEHDIELGIAGPGDDLYVSAIRWGDDDVLSRGLRVNGPSSEPVEIILKPNGGTVEVAVRTSKGEPCPEAVVALLPDPPRREQIALINSCVADARGVCTLRGIAPGDYHLVAASKEAGINFRDPDSTKDLANQSKAVKIAEGDRQSLEIEVASDSQ